MRLLIITVIVVAALTIAYAQPQEPLASASFEGDLEGWSLQLNRGGEVELSYPEDAAVGERSLRFEPQALCAPGDIVSPTNIHIWREFFSFERGRRYERRHLADRSGDGGGPEALQRAERARPHACAAPSRTRSSHTTASGCCLTRTSRGGVSCTRSRWGSEWWDR